jgi:predicted negative regulator of RcsB-dependent stress response
MSEIKDKEYYMATTPTTHNPVDDVLNETELGSFIAKNKGLIIGLVVLVIAGVFAWGGYNTFTTNKNDELSSIVFNFKNENFKNLTEKKMSPKDFTAAYLTMSAEVKDFSGLVPFALLASDELFKQEAIESSLNVLKTVENHSNPFMVYFVHSRMAVAHEDLSQVDLAITDLEKIVKSNVKVMESKTYLDLGRLYLKKGDKVKAKSNFQFVIDNLGQAEFVKLARLYLSDLEL